MAIGELFFKELKVSSLVVTAHDEIGKYETVIPRCPISGMNDDFCFRGHFDAVILKICMGGDDASRGVGKA